MKRLLLASILLLGLASPIGSSEIKKTEPKKDEKPKKSKFAKIIARITFWTHNEDGYFWGKKIASDPHKQAESGSTVAIDPNKIPYGTKIWIPGLNGTVGDGLFVAEDTGSAVKKMQAIPKVRRKEVQYVIDVYVDSIKQMNQLANSMPQYMEVYILKEG